MDKAKFWERKYRRNLGRIVGICYRYVNDRAVAEDLAQDVFVKAMEKFTTIRAIGRFDAWLTHIAVNHCIDHLRRQPDFVPIELESIAETSTKEEMVWTADFTEEELLEAIGQLPEIQRTVFNLHAMERYSHRRIAGMLGISADNARQLHHRARERLCQMLADRHKEKEKRKKGLLFMIILFASLKRAHANPRRIDRLYRSRLSGYRMEPTNVESHPGTSLQAHLRDTDAHHISTTLATQKNAILLITAAGVAGVTGGAIGFQIGRNTTPVSGSGNGPVVVETQCIASLPDTTDDHHVIGTNNHSSLWTKTVPTRTGNVKIPVEVETFHETSLQETSLPKTSPHPQNVTASNPVPDTTPIIITTKIPVRQTVVIRDTTSISDTVFLIKNEE